MVGLVASAGGLDALGQVLAPSPPASPPRSWPSSTSGPSTPAAWPRSSTAAPPSASSPPTTATGSGRGWSLVCPDHAIALIDSGQTPPSRPSADLLLTSMALSCRERAVAVVLSGAGHDGTAGAAAVKRMGGLVLAQDQATSTEFGMPGSAIAFDQIVDRVLALGHIGPTLDELVSA